MAAVAVVLAATSCATATGVSTVEINAIPSTDDPDPSVGDPGATISEAGSIDWSPCFGGPVTGVGEGGGVGMGGGDEHVGWVDPGLFRCPLLGLIEFGAMDHAAIDDDYGDGGVLRLEDQGAGGEGIVGRLGEFRSEATAQMEGITLRSDVGNRCAGLEFCGVACAEEGAPEEEEEEE